MKIFTGEQLQGCFKKLNKHANVFNEMVQQALLSCSFYAFKDGNTTPFDQLIEAVGPGVHLEHITRWIELVAGIGRVYKGKIALNKKVREMSGVIDEATFEEYYADMSQVKWYEAGRKQQAVSVFDEGVYLNGVMKKLTKNGYAGLADALKQAELMYFVAQAKLHSEVQQPETEEQQ